MAQEFRLQDPGEGIHEAEIQEVYVSPGDTVEDGDNLMAVETDKALVDIPAPFDGVIEEIRVEEGTTVRVGDVLLTYREQREKASEEKTEETGSDAASSKEAKDKSEEERDKSKESTEKQNKTAKKSSAAKTDKSSTGPKYRERDYKESGESQQSAQSTKQAETQQSAKQATSDDTRPVPASPATRRVARELNVDLHQVEPSGPEGRVTTEDVQAFAEQQGPTERPSPALPDFEQWGPVQREPLRSIRRATAQQMTLAWSQIPHAIHQDVVDITELEQFRQENKDSIEQQGGKLTLTPLVMKAVVALLREFPRFNASLDTENEEIVLKEYYHLGVAVQTDRGLLVPVVRDVDRKSLIEIAVDLTELAERTRAGEATRDDLQGGTFTLTNPGPIGGTGFSPIINYPEAAILGLGKAQLQPTVQGTLDDYSIVPRLMLPIALAYDHRINDGAEAGEFIRRLKTLLADPEQFMLAI